ncbi:uncharacterized protein KGF55_002669 [Candida pseudojiufengensis]|uniref:uncharacterized protein n=1 Tax=Candida pseudojiufengensis TaxID=497109 RepID=UPI002223FE27|nr:uncharacterized protein KGF55_002669 [Candida pseudojiufengensis]KAI5963789.1 hypothetical protein KGF55_002669 [Candida pseudojiufengensis]
MPFTSGRQRSLSITSSQSSFSSPQPSFTTSTYQPTVGFQNSPKVESPPLLIPQQQSLGSERNEEQDITSGTSLNSTQISSNSTNQTPILQSTSLSTSQNGNIVPTPNSTRSMSIISLDRSPRNSIVSLDENLRTRNNSTSSLASLGHVNNLGNILTMTPASNSMNQNSNIIDNFNKSRSHVISQQHHKLSSSAVISDDDSDYNSGGSFLNSNIPTKIQNNDSARKIVPENKQSYISNRPKRRSIKDDSFKVLKEDFRFKFHESNQAAVPTSPISHLKNTNLHSLNASPTSEFVSINQHANSEKEVSTLRGQREKTTSISSNIPPKSQAHSSNTKKVKNNTLIQQSIYIKRKLAFSKDLQLEYSGNSFSPSSASFKMPSSPTINPSSSNHMTLAPSLIDSNNMSTSSTNDKIRLPPLESNIITNTKSNTPMLPSITAQNELISKLNKKWNKAMMYEKNNLKDFKKDHETWMNNLAILPNKRKRSRRISFDDDVEYESYEEFTS